VQFRRRFTYLYLYGYISVVFNRGDTKNQPVKEKKFKNKYIFVKKNHIIIFILISICFDFKYKAKIDDAVFDSIG